MPVAEGGRAKSEPKTGCGDGKHVLVKKKCKCGGRACFRFPSCTLQRLIAPMLVLSNNSRQRSEAAVTTTFQAGHVLQKFCQAFSVVPFVGRRLPPYALTHHSKLDVEFIKNFVFLSDIRLHARHLDAVGLYLGKSLLTEEAQTPTRFSGCDQPGTSIPRFPLRCIVCICKRCYCCSWIIKLHKRIV